MRPEMSVEHGHDRRDRRATGEVDTATQAREAPMHAQAMGGRIRCGKAGAGYASAKSPATRSCAASNGA